MSKLDLFANEKNCPFCGGATQRAKLVEDCGKAAVTFSCHLCGACGPCWTIEYNDLSEAITEAAKQWNRREGD